MRAHISPLSLGLLFTVAYAAPVFSPQQRLTPSEVDAMPAHDSGAGTSGVAGIRTTVMSGDPTQDAARAGWRSIRGPLSAPISRSRMTAFGRPTSREGWPRRDVRVAAEERSAKADSRASMTRSISPSTLRTRAQAFSRIQSASFHSASSAG
jgi:hypothetical protein